MLEKEKNAAHGGSPWLGFGVFMNGTSVKLCCTASGG